MADPALVDPSGPRPSAITGETRIAAVIGSPVRHSLSPLIHNAAFEAAGLDWVFAAFDVEPGSASAAVDAARALGLGGLSVTMPHKRDIIGALDRLTAVAERLDAVNCVFWDGDQLVGDNTDGAGFLTALRREWDLDVTDRRVAVLGSGGAAAAVVDALAAEGAASIAVVGRNAGTVDRILALGRGRAVAAAPGDAHGADIVVNATPVGMVDTPGLPSTVISGRGCHVIDLIYHPRRTQWMTRCEEAGARVMGGVPMLIGQAEAAFERWTGQKAPHAAIVDAFSAAGER